MNGDDISQLTSPQSRSTCLVAGCSCKDARIVSTRRASYFASVAKVRGETADRIIEAEPGWVLPVSSEPDRMSERVALNLVDVAAHLDAAA
jgi:hypothetical protein